MKKIGIYIHIPFCISKCKYCDFYSFCDWDNQLQNEYIDAVCKHLIQKSADTHDYTVDSIFIGGGTPTVLQVNLLENIAKCIFDNYNIAKKLEFTIEANPKTFDPCTLSAYLSLGINRLSIGLQSANNDELSTIGRIHTYENFKTAFNDARNAGFTNINVDLMYGLPNQTPSSFVMSLNQVISLSPEHISLYSLQLEKGTDLYNNLKNYSFPCEDDVCKITAVAQEILKKYDYNKYEISNYAKDGFECEHNKKYWLCMSYLGFGAASHSYFDGYRYAYEKDVKRYIMAAKNNDFSAAVSYRQQINKAEMEKEYIMLRMRLTKGIDLSDFQEKFGSFSKYEQKFKFFESKGLLKTDGKHWFFTDTGMNLSNYLLSEILF